MRRLFLALLCGRERGARLAQAVAESLGGRSGQAPGGYRLPRAEGLHLTLFYLGATDEPRAQRVARGMRAVAGLPAPRLVLAGTGAFPGLERPRVLWVGVREEEGSLGRLEALFEAVLALLGGSGVETASERARPFRPHVTVARPRGPGPVPDAFRRLALELAWDPHELHLVESVPAHGAPRYVSRRSVTLAG